MSSIIFQKNFISSNTIKKDDKNYVNQQYFFANRFKDY